MMRILYTFISLFIFSFCYSQVNENFSDGDFTTNPTWTLNSASDFTVVTGQLRSANTTTNSNFYISTTNTLATSCQWEFYVNLQFSTSGTNYVDAYLISDMSNLQSASINGYFVRIGNTADEISLYRRSGATGTSTMIIDGLNGTVSSSSNNLIKIKVTRNAANLFTLERDMTGTGSSYTSEGSFIDATFTTSNSFGFFIQQSTASFVQKHFFDDIVVGPIMLDVTPPSLVSATPISATAVDVLFNEDIDLVTSQTASNYTINAGIGNPTSATRDGSNLKLVHLSLGSSLTSGNTYTVDVDAVQDMAGNAMSTSSVSFSYVAFSTPVFNDVIINEIMIDINPVPAGVPAKQYLELYNKSTKYFNLNGWQFNDGQTTTTITGNYSLNPNSYVLIAKSSDTVLFVGINNKIGTSTFPTYNVTGDPVFLSDNLGTIIDSIRYTTSWYRDAVKDDGGWSLELINPTQNSNCLASNNWSASNDSDGGTPGFVNSVYSTTPDVTGPSILSATVLDATHLSVCFNDVISASQLSTNSNFTINNSIGSPTLATANGSNMCVTLSLSNAFINNSSYTLSVTGVTDCNGNAIATPAIGFAYVVFDTPVFNDVIVNEMMIDVNPVPVGVPARQYLELYNKSNKYFNLNGWQLSDGQTITTITTNYALYPNSYVVIAKSTDTSLFTGITNKIGTSTFPTFNITGDPVFLTDNFATTIDSLRYTTLWYQDAIKDDGGWSLELINPTQNASCSPLNNWIASTNANGGTPGVINSVYAITPDLVGPSISDITIIDSLHISVCFNDLISPSQLTIATNYSVNGIIATPTLAIASNGNMCATLSLATKLSNATNYTLTVTGITDCNGNNLTPNTGTFSYYKHKAYDVVINELMPDPDPAINLPNEEYVELKNRTAFSINLKNWSFSTPSSTKKLPNITIKPDSFIVLTGTGNADIFYNQFGIVAYDVASFPSLLNDGTTLALRDSNGVVINSITYSSSWYNDNNKSGGGWSLEQLDPNNPCGGQNNWHASNDVSGGTPGRRNSVLGSNPDNTIPQLERIAVTSADTIILVFTEQLDSASLTNSSIYTFDNGLTQPTYVLPLAPEYKKVKLTLSAPMQIGTIYNCTVLTGITDCVGNLVSSGSSAPFALPQAPSPNDVVVNEILFDEKTGGTEFVEIYNRSSKTIDLKDLRIGSMDTLTGDLKDTEVITEEGFLLFPETYLVLSEDGNTVKQQYLTTNPKGFYDVQTLPSMTNEADVVTLSDANTTVIDNFKYTVKMHFPLLVSTDGVSLERIDFNRSTDDRTNWNSASEAVGFATPAYRNSQYLQADGGNGVTISEPLFSPDNDGYNDVLNITYKLDETGKAANIFIYDSKGRLVRHLVRNEQLSMDGTISWNGINDDNEKAPIGIYVVYVELFNLSGKINKYKLACTLAGKL